MRRPALWTGLLFALGTVLQAMIALPLLAVLLTALGGLVGCVLSFWIRQDAWCSVLLALVMLLLGALRFEMGTQQFPRDHYVYKLNSTEVILEGQLVSEPEERARGWRAEMHVGAVCRGDTTWKTTGRILVSFGERVALGTYGDYLRIRVVPTRPEPARNPGGFDYRRYLSLRGIQALALVRRADQVILYESREGVWWMQGIIPVRNTIKGAIDQNLSGGPAGLLKGILLGDKRAVPSSVRDVFTRCGINHVLAVSGLHVGLIAGVVFFGLRLFGVGRGLTACTTLVLVLVYALVTGLPPSVIRASIMAGLVILGGLSDWDTDGWNALGLAGLAGLIARPGDILDVGFQLSFVATGGILLFYRPLLLLLPQWGGRVCANWIWAPLAVSLAAQVATMPLIITYFGLLSVVGLVANLIVVPLVAAAAALGLMSVLLFPLTSTVVMWLNGANWVLLKVAIFSAELLSSASWAAFDVPQLPLYQWGLYGAFALLILPYWRRRSCLVYVLCGVLLCANYGVWQPILMPNRNLVVYVLDVGQGDGIFLQFPNGKTMLVDGGIRTQHADVGERVILPFLRSQGISKVDVVVGSHAHSDHIGGLISVLSRVNVGHYLDSGQVAPTWTAREVRRLVEEKGIVYHAVAAGDSLVGLGGVGGLILHPVPQFVKNDGEVSHGLNNGSVVMRLQYGENEILLTGDIEHETDGALLRWQERLQADVLKAAHHGSKTSSTQAFLNGVKPQWIAVSCGIKNKFRHPSPEVIARYDFIGGQTLRTDLMGAIRFVMDGQQIQVDTWLKK